MLFRICLLLFLTFILNSPFYFATAQEMKIEELGRLLREKDWEEIERRTYEIHGTPHSRTELLLELSDQFESLVTPQNLEEAEKVAIDLVKAIFEFVPRAGINLSAPGGWMTTKRVIDNFVATDLSYKMKSLRFALIDALVNQSDFASLGYLASVAFEFLDARIHLELVERFLALEDAEVVRGLIPGFFASAQFSPTLMRPLVRRAIEVSFARKDHTGREAMSDMQALFDRRPLWVSLEDRNFLHEKIAESRARPCRDALSAPTNSN